MKLYILLAAVFLFAGCQKRGSIGLSSTASSGGACLFDGQSNAAQMDMEYVRKTLGCQTVNIAVGDTSLAQHIKGGEFYANLIATLKQLMKRGPVIYVFYQGEWEGKNAIGHDTWNQRFTEHIQNIRTESGLTSMPVYFFRINEHRYDQYPAYAWEKVRDEQDGVHVQSTTMISSDGCELSHDELHYTTDGYHCLTDRLASEIRGE